jgi:uncharacterized pyridoxamine 5'-phosphate oxidase family protein
MKVLPEDVVNFLERQGFSIVSTLDAKGKIHCAAKGIVGIEKQGKVFLIDLYKAGTFRNLQRNPTISITSVDEHMFMGYTLKGKAKIVERSKIKARIIKAWEERVIQRISKRVIKSIKDYKKSGHHPEAKFPHPEYLIEMSVEDIVDLTPAHLKKARS